MKKRFLIFLCLVLGAGALFGEVTLPVTLDFERQSVWGTTPRYDVDDEGRTNDVEGVESSLSFYWWYYGDTNGNASVMDSYENLSIADKHKYQFPDGMKRPSYMHVADENLGLLKVSTLSRLMRTFEPIASYKGPADGDVVEIPEKSGLYFDALMALEVNGDEQDPQEFLDNGDKIALYPYCEEGSDVTNLYIVAGSMVSDGADGWKTVPTNYPTSYRFDGKLLHRVTIKAVANAATRSGDTVPAFLVFVDGVQVTCGVSEYNVGEMSAELFAGSEDFVKRGLFPSIQASIESDSARNLHGWTVCGSGYIDETGLTEVNPIYEATNSLPLVVVCDDSMVTNLTITTNGVLAVEVETAPFNGTKIMAYPGEKIEIETKCKKPYIPAQEWVLSGNLASYKTLSGHTITMADGNDEGKFDDPSKLVVIVNSETAYFEVDGGQFTTFYAAMTAATKSVSHLIKMQADLKLSSNERYDQGQARVRPLQTAIIDLAGKSIKGDFTDDEATIYNQGTLTIIDSVGGGVIEAPGTIIENGGGEEDWSQIASNVAANVDHVRATLTMGAMNSEYFCVKGRVKCTQGKLSIVSGDYLTPPDESKSTFYLTEYLAPRSRATDYDGAEGQYWSVAYDGSLYVQFKVPYGEVSPEKVNVPDGGKVSQPTVTAPGYCQVTNELGEAIWTNSQGVAWNFADEVTEDMTLYAEMELIEFDITYDRQVAGNPDSYDVEQEIFQLKDPVRANFTFTGWQDEMSGKMVDSVGKGAKFVGTEQMVTGNLSLVSQWIANTLAWSNTVNSAAESNGWYAGSWEFKLPATSTLTAGTKVQIDEIGFCIVNPTQYPKTSEYLAVTNENAAIVPVISQARTWETNALGWYVVGSNCLSNLRPKLGYKFTDLEVTVGDSNYLTFSSTPDAITATNAFLRLTLEGGDTAIGTCLEAGGNMGDEKFDSYLDYYPVYEIKGHVKEGGEP